MKAFYGVDGLEKYWLLAVDQDLQIILDAELHADYYDFRNGGGFVPQNRFECTKVENRK
jgi:hypothetical protein